MVLSNSFVTCILVQEIISILMAAKSNIAVANADGETVLMLPGVSQDVLEQLRTEAAANSLA